MQRRVVLREQPLVSRNADDCGAAGPENPRNFGNSRYVVLDVLEHVGGHDCVEGCGAKWEVGSAAATELCLPPLARESDRA